LQHLDGLEERRGLLRRPLAPGHEVVRYHVVESLDLQAENLTNCEAGQVACILKDVIQQVGLCEQSIGSLAVSVCELFEAKPQHVIFGVKHEVLKTIIQIVNPLCVDLIHDLEPITM
jgi:hypothetical protein